MGKAMWVNYLTVIKKMDTLFYSRKQWPDPLKAFSTNPWAWTQMYRSNFLYLRFKNQLDKLKNGEVFETEL
jgi:hypothetical protein